MKSSTNSWNHIFSERTMQSNFKVFLPAISLFVRLLYEYEVVSQLWVPDGSLPPAASQRPCRPGPNSWRIDYVLSAVPVAGLYLSSGRVPVDLAELQQV